MPTEEQLRDDYRAAEDRLLAEYGLTATETMVAVPGEDTRLHVIDIPGDPDRPPVLLLHGIASVTAAAIPLIPGFDGRRVIAMDWPGHGLSSAAQLRRAGIRTQPVRWMQAVIDAFGLDRFDLAGHSLGGQFALYYCLAQPERVRSLILLGVPGAALPEMRPPAAMRLMVLPGLAGWVMRRPVTREQYEANSALTLGAGTVQGWPRELVDCGYYSSLRQAFVESLPSYYKALASAFGVRRAAVVAAEQLATLGMPVLLLWGDDDVFLSPEAAQKSIASIARAKLVTLEGGHAPWLNSPEAAREAVRTFLDRVP